jgi:hypothetical protein
MPETGYGPPRSRHTPGVTYLSGWRLGLALVVGVLFALLVLTTLLWFAALLAIVMAVAILNLVLLPRVARRLRIPRLALDLACLALLAGAGWLLAGTTGLVAGAIGWLVGIGAPRLVAHRLRDRVQVTASTQGEILELEAGTGTQQPDVWRWERRP